MKKLWERDSHTEPYIQRFTVGTDWRYDNELVIADALASIAHATGLAAIGILQQHEVDRLQKAFRDIIDEHCDRPIVTDEYEDCHSALEFYLQQRVGELGKKIHSGRSRNDQVFTALLLYGRQRLFELHSATARVAHALLVRASQEEHTPMVGRTHLHRAMPSTVGLWAAAFAEQYIALYPYFDALYTTTNCSPMGSAAGYGAPLPLDRPLVSSLLAFREPIHTVLACANTRGHWEARYLDILGELMLIASRIAQDILLFSLPEFGYFSLPQSFTTGSSIMPHKKNPDVLELLRAKAAKIITSSTEVRQIVRSLPSGYNRDLQEIKPLFIDTLTECIACLTVMAMIIEGMEVNREALTASIDPQIYSVDEAMRLVEEKGMTFRDAYHHVKNHGVPQRNQDYRILLQRRTAVGSPGNIGIDILERKLREQDAQWKQRQTTVDTALHALIGAPISVTACSDTHNSTP